MDLHQLADRIRAEARAIAYAVVRGDTVTVGAAIGGLYLICFAGLLNLFGGPLVLVDAGIVAGVLGCGLAWVRALRPALDRVLTVAYFAGGAGFLAALAQHRMAAAVALLALVRGITIALTVSRIVRHRARKRTGPAA